MNKARLQPAWRAIPVMLVLVALIVVWQVLPGTQQQWIQALGRVAAAQLDRLTAPGVAAAPPLTPFPGQGDDSAPSLGRFAIFVAPNFQAMMTGYPGYDAASDIMVSPILADPTTIIGRSAPHLHGSPPDLNGTPVGTAGVMVADGDFTIMPAGFQGPADTREVHTRIHDFNIAGLGGLVMVRAGASAPNRPNSIGEVESLSGASGDPNLDFPAQSFFDVFVEVDLPPAASFPGGTLLNDVPLLVINDDLSSFPPHVVYIHGQTPAVPVVFLHDDPGNAWRAGDLFGWLSLAGHGMNFTDTPPDHEEFQNIMRFEPSMPLACQTFHPSDRNGDAMVDLRDITLIAGRWPLHAGIQDVQTIAGAFGAGCQTDPGPPLLVPLGDDVFASPPGQTMLMLQLPLGFFGPGSDPFIGTVQLGGNPISPPSNQPFEALGPFRHVAQQAMHGVVDARQAGAQGDTIVRRNTSAMLFDPFTPAGTQTIPIEIVALSLTSVNPIVVTYNGGQNPQQWSVQMSATPSMPQETGALTLTRTSAQGGTFTAELPVTSQLVFTNLSGPGTVGPIERTDTFYTGFGTQSPLGPSYDTGAPVPWVVQ